MVPSRLIVGDCDPSASQEAPPGEPEQGLSFDAYMSVSGSLTRQPQAYNSRQGRVKEEAPLRRRPVAGLPERDMNAWSGRTRRRKHTLTEGGQ